MKKISKKIIIVVGIILLTIMMLQRESKAILQANINTHYKKTDSFINWISNIRSMEKSGEAMGLNETLNDDLTPSSESNNIDVHFVRSTELGAVKILSASGYGNPQKLYESAIKTTTGNKTGVYFSGIESWEFIAGGYGVAPGGVNDRYYDSYTTSQESARAGDALGNATTVNPGCAGWHSSGYGLWFFGDRPYYIFNSSQMFSFCYNGNFNYCGRGVAVCGNGF